MDLDGDGIRDIISGSYPGELYLIAGRPEGGFRAPVVIADRDGDPIRLSSASVPFAVDWDRDGDLDLAVGDIRGRVHFVRNESGDGSLSLGGDELVEAEGEQIACGQGDAGPVVADWDGDGTLDLILGTGEGSVLLYRNTVRQGPPRLLAPTVLVPPSSLKPGNEPSSDASPAPGIRAKVCVDDWNGDGRLDLIVGDFGVTRKAEPKEELQSAGMPLLNYHGWVWVYLRK
ncbi:FG-GAP repeat domain-containing protein [Gemmatimonadota bacterium]